MTNQETELKLKIDDRGEVVTKLLGLGARLKSVADQEDILFNNEWTRFETRDQALRLRMEVVDGQSKAILGFKGTAQHDTDGHTTRDEYETAVDGEMVRKIFKEIGFNEALTVKKHRESYELDGLDIAIDELKFGTFIELEGDSDVIQKVRNGLGLGDAEPVKKGYGDMQDEWETNNK